MGFVEWFRRLLAPSSVAPPAPAAARPASALEPPGPITDEEILAELTRTAAEGYDDDAAVIEQVRELLADGERAGDDLPARVARLAPQVFEARAAEERSWPVPTDCDRLDRAFERLEQAGVVARQDFTCCQTCGHAEIGGEIDQAVGPVRGYTFFHQQDTERAAEGGGLYLAYGAVMPEGTSKEAWIQAEVAVAGEVVAALRAEGLAPSWNGEASQRIQVPLEWRRRRSRA